MARFYKTTTPDFVDDFMYTPPWELAGKIMEANEQGIQTTLASTAMFQDFDIQHIDDPVLKKQAEEIKNKYASSADDITKNIQAELSSNPQAWRSHLPKIGNLAQELQKDFKSGDIFKMMSDSQRQASWVENNKKAFEQNPELANAAYNAIMTDFRSDPERKKEWSAGMFDKLSDFDINSKEILDAVKEYEAKTVQQPDGKGGLIEVKYKDKDELVNNYMNTVLADPKAQRYIQQATALGLPGFVDSKGNPLPLRVPVDRITKERVSEEEFEREKEKFFDPNLTPEDRVKQGREVFKYEVIPNKDFAWTKNFVSLADRIGGEISRKYTADPVYSAAVKRRHDFTLAQFKHDLKMDAKAVEDAAKAKKEEKKAAAELSILNDEIATMEAAGQTKSKKYEEKVAKRNALQKNNVNRLSTVYNNINFEKSQDILGNSEMKNTPEYNFIRNIDNSVLENAFNKSGLGDAYKRVKEGDDRFKDFNQIVVETYLAFNDNAEIAYNEEGSFKLKQFENKEKTQEAQHRQIKDFLINNYGKTEEDFTQKIKIKNKRGTTIGESLYVNTPWFEDFLKKFNTISENKKEAYKNFSMSYEEDALALIKPELEQTIRNEYSLNTSNYTLIPATQADYKNNKYKDVIFPTSEEIESSSKTKILGLNPHSPYGVTPMIKYGEEIFFMVSNQGVTESNEKSRRLFSNPNDYRNSADFILIDKNLKDIGYRNIVNYLSGLKSLASSGVSKIDNELPQLEIDPVSNKPKRDENNSLVYRRDPKTGEILYSNYNEVSASSGIGEVFTIREYYDSGYETPYFIFKDGKPQFSTESLLAVSEYINEYVSKVLEDFYKKRGEEGSTEEYFNIIK